jgi:hypothetical protein
MTFHGLAAFVVMLSLTSQVTKMTPDSPRFMNDDPVGATWKVFAVDSYDSGPIGVVQVEEVRQQNPPSHWAVSVQNRGLMPVLQFRMAAAVVTGDGKIKGTQLLQTIKNLKPGQVSRQQIKVFPTILNPTDRVVFYVSELTTDVAPWKSDKDAVTGLIKSMAARYPVP